MISIISAWSSIPFPIRRCKTENHCQFDLEAFIEDARVGIKKRYRTQEAYAFSYGVCRATMNSMLRHPLDIEFQDLLRIASDLGLDLRDYLR